MKTQNKKLLFAVILKFIVMTALLTSCAKPAIEAPLNAAKVRPVMGIKHPEHPHVVNPNQQPGALDTSQIERPFRYDFPEF